MSSTSSGGDGDVGGMTSRPVHAYFKRLNLNANERWIEASIAEVRRANDVGMSALIKSCYERWTATDISTDDIQVRNEHDARCTWLRLLTSVCFFFKFPI